MKCFRVNGFAKEENKKLEDVTEWFKEDAADRLKRMVQGGGLEYGADIHLFLLETEDERDALCHAYAAVKTRDKSMSITQSMKRNIASEAYRYHVPCVAYFHFGVLCFFDRYVLDNIKFAYELLTNNSARYDVHEVGGKSYERAYCKDCNHYDRIERYCKLHVFTASPNYKCPDYNNDKNPEMHVEYNKRGKQSEYDFVKDFLENSHKKLLFDGYREI